MLGAVLHILAQRDSGDWWENLIYLALFVLLPLLGGLGKWLQKRSGMTRDEEVQEGDVVVLPEERPRDVPRARPLMPVPQRQVPLPRPHVRPPAPPPPAHRPMLRPPSARPVPPPIRRPPKRVPAEPAPIPVAPFRRPEDEIPSIAVQPVVPRTPRVAAEHFVRLGPLDVEGLRRAIILNEVLQPPVALREPGGQRWE